MGVRFNRSLAIPALALVAAGCDGGVTDPGGLEQFTWGQVPAGEVVEDGIDVSQVLADIFILGELNAPTRCYGLDADLDRSGSDLTLNVEARPNQSGSCEDTAGGYRYTAVLRNLEPREYRLRVVHSVVDGETREFIEMVTIR